MTMFGDPANEGDKRLDSQLWHACAGGMVQMPTVDSKVYYFPQGHAEHSQTNVDFGNPCRIPALILCRVCAVKFMADRVTDEVFAKIHLDPVRSPETDYSEDDGLVLFGNGPELPEKPASFAKQLTQSDANNGGGFSVPRYCAETIFPRLDYSADPPVQTILVHDVHGEVWKFRHIYRGTPRRHLLTTGWSNFVNQKKLVAGDSIVFLRTKNGDLCVGIRRAKRGVNCGADSIFGWNPSEQNCVSSYAPFSVHLREEEKNLIRTNDSCNGNTNLPGIGHMRGRGRVSLVKAESLIDAATLAASGQPFEVVYYPRASTPEFCVKAATVRAAMRIRWCSGMRFKMPFETEDASRISWFTGTISSVQSADPHVWPRSPWKLLQVIWDEPDLLQNVKQVSPWLVELISNMPAIYMRPFSPPRKKLRIPQHPNFPLDGQQLPTPALYSGNPLGPSSNSFNPAGIQGARHAQFGSISLPDLHLNKLPWRPFQDSFHQLDHPSSTLSRISTSTIISDLTIHDNISLSLTIGNPAQSSKKSYDEKTPHFWLFGMPIILTAEQISMSNCGNSLSGGIPNEFANFCNGLAVEKSSEGLAWYKDQRATEIGLETGHCKVFMESEDVDLALDLSVLGSYEELYERLEEMFGTEKLEMRSRILYCDAFGAVKRAVDEPFSDFVKTARSVNILLD